MIRKVSYGIVPAISFILICQFALTEAKIPTRNGKNAKKDSAGDNAPPATEVARKMMDRLNQRDKELQNYTESRTYEVRSDDKKAPSVINAVMNFSSPPAAKDFTVVSKSNAGSVINLIYDHETKAEKDALTITSQKQSRITTENYTFVILGRQMMNGIECYVLQTIPKRSDKMLLRGKVWVTTDNFDLVRIEGAPAKSPSIWIKNITFVRQFQNVNGYWFPQQDESTVDVRLYGRIKIKIDHHDLKVGK
jgi:hypothetical protein